jgi:hypothetical protein
LVCTKIETLKSFSVSIFTDFLFVFNRILDNIFTRKHLRTITANNKHIFVLFFTIVRQNNDILLEANCLNQFLPLLLQPCGINSGRIDFQQFTSFRRCSEPVEQTEANKLVKINQSQFLKASSLNKKTHKNASFY